MEKKPNVIVFFTDQQRYDTMGINGNPCGLTPNFDRLAANGTHVPLAFTPQPVCGPARAVIQTGKFATTTDNHRNGLPLGRDHKSLADYFNAAGYYTGYIGKWHLGSRLDYVEEHDRAGYQWWLGANIIEAITTQYNTILFDNENRPVKLPGYRSDALTDAAIRFIDENQKRPFFLFLSFLEPHFQNQFDSYPPPEVLKDQPAGYIPPDLASLGGTSWQHLSGYYGMVKRLDEGLGRVMDALKSLGLEEDTILLFTSDHGCHFKTRNAEYKRSCHESSVRIPFAMTGRPFTGGGRLREMVSLVDVAPTLLDACGMAIPEDMQGRSFLPLLHGQKTEERDILIQISETQVGRAIRTKRWKYSVEAPDKDPIKDAGALQYTETFLYDLEHDPYELNNLIHSKAHEPVTNILAGKLKKLMEQAGEEVPEIIHVPKEKNGWLTVYPGEEQL